MDAPPVDGHRIRPYPDSEGRTWLAVEGYGPPIQRDEIDLKGVYGLAIMRHHLPALRGAPIRGLQVLNGRPLKRAVLYDVLESLPALEFLGAHDLDGLHARVFARLKSLVTNGGAFLRGKDLPLLDWLQLLGPDIASFEEIELPAIRALDVRHRGRAFVSTAGLERYEFKRLLLLDLPCLRDLSGVRSVKRVDIELSKSADLATLPDPCAVEELLLRSQGRIPTVRFVERIEGLQMLVIGHPTIVDDGDLSPLASVRTVVLRNRRHYSHRLVDGVLVPKR